METSKNCSSCDAPILFAPTEYGKPMPLDAAPVLLEGTYEIGVDGVARFVSAGAREGKTLYLPHFATCPNADAHRRRKK
jgi:hypothetical protein